VAQDPYPWSYLEDSDDDVIRSVSGDKSFSLGLGDVPVTERAYERFGEAFGAGEVDLLDVLSDALENPGQYVPWGSAYLEAKDANEILEAAKALEYDKYEEGSPQEQEASALVAEHLDEMLLKKTGGAKFAELLLNLPKYMGEFGVGRAAVGAKAASKQAIAKMMREILEESGQKNARKSLVRRFMGGQPWKESVKIYGAMEMMPELTRAVGGHGGRTSGSIYRRMMPGVEFDRDEVGNLELALDKNFDSFIESAPFGILDRYIETVSESMGGSLGLKAVQGRAQQAIRKRAPALLRLKALQHQVVGDFMKRSPGLSKFATATKKIGKEGGWDGMWEEWLEERFGANLRTISMVDQDEFILEMNDGSVESVNWDRLTPDLEQWVVELAGFAVPGAATAGVDMVLNRENWSFKRKFEEVMAFTGEDYVPHSADIGIQLEDLPAFVEENKRQPLNDMELLEWIETKYQAEVKGLTETVEQQEAEEGFDELGAQEAEERRRQERPEEFDQPAEEPITQEDVDAEVLEQEELEEEVRWRTEEMREEQEAATEAFEDYLEENYPDEDKRDQRTVSELIEANKDEELRALAVETLNYPDIRGDTVEVEAAAEVRAVLDRMEADLGGKVSPGSEVKSRQVEAPTQRHAKMAAAAGERYGVDIGFYDLEVDGAPSDRIGGTVVKKGPNGRPMVMLNQRLHANQNSEQMASTILHELWHDRWKGAPKALKKFLEAARELDPERVAELEKEVRERYKTLDRSDEQIEDELGAHLVEQLVATKAILDRPGGRPFMTQVALGNRTTGEAVVDGFKSLIGLFGGDMRKSYQQRLDKLKDMVEGLAPEAQRVEGQAEVRSDQQAAQLTLLFDELFEMATLGTRKAREAAAEEAELADDDQVEQEETEAPAEPVTAESLAAQFSRDELVAALAALGATKTGNKQALAQRLLDEAAGKELPRGRRRGRPSDRELIENMRARIAEIEAMPADKNRRHQRNKKNLIQNLQARILEVEERIEKKAQEHPALALAVQAAEDAKMAQKPLTERQPKGARRVWQRTYEDLRKSGYDPEEIDAAAEKLWESVDSDRPALTAALLLETGGEITEAELGSVDLVHDTGPLDAVNDSGLIYELAEVEAGMPIKDFIHAGLIENLGASPQQKRDFAEGSDIKPLTLADIEARADQAVRESGELYHEAWDVTDQESWDQLKQIHDAFHGFAERGDALKPLGKRHAIASFRSGELQAVAVLGTPSGPFNNPGEILELNKVVTVGQEGVDQHANNAASAITRQAIEIAKQNGQTLVTYSEVGQAASPYRALTDERRDGYELVPNNVTPHRKARTGEITPPKIRWMAGPRSRTEPTLLQRPWEIEAAAALQAYQEAQQVGLFDPRPEAPAEQPVEEEPEPERIGVPVSIRARRARQEADDMYAAAVKKVNALARGRNINRTNAINWIAERLDMLEWVYAEERGDVTAETAEHASGLARLLLTSAKNHMSTQDYAMLMDRVADWRQSREKEKAYKDAAERIGTSEQKEGDSQTVRAGRDADLKRHRETKPYVYIVTCGQAKRSVQSTASDMYTSATFTLSKRLATKRGDHWMILSAEHGLLDPDQLIDPYNETLKKGEALEKALKDPKSRESQIAESAGRQAWARFGPDVNYVILGPRHYVRVFERGLKQAKDEANDSRSAGEEFISGNHPVLYGLSRDNAQTPLSGKTIIDTNKWLKRELSAKKGRRKKKKAKKARARGPRANPWTAGGKHYEAAMERGEIDIITYLQAHGYKLNAYFFNSLWDRYKQGGGRHGGKGSSFLPKLFDAPLGATPGEIKREWDQSGITPDKLVSSLRGSVWDDYFPVEDPNRPDEGFDIEELLLEAWDSPGSVVPQAPEDVAAYAEELQGREIEAQESRLDEWLYEVQGLLEDVASGDLTRSELSEEAERNYTDALLYEVDHPGTLELDEAQWVEAKIAEVKRKESSKDENKRVSQELDPGADVAAIDETPDMDAPKLRRRKTGQQLITGEEEEVEVPGQRSDEFPAQAVTEIGLYDEQGGLFEQQAEERDKGLGAIIEEVKEHHLDEFTGRPKAFPISALSESARARLERDNVRQMSDKYFKGGDFYNVDDVIKWLKEVEARDSGIEPHDEDPPFALRRGPAFGGPPVGMPAPIGMDPLRSNYEVRLTPAENRWFAEDYADEARAEAESGANYYRDQGIVYSDGVVRFRTHRQLLEFVDSHVVRHEPASLRAQGLSDRLPPSFYAGTFGDKATRIVAQGPATDPTSYALRSEHTASPSRGPWVSKAARILSSPGLPNKILNYQQLEKMLLKRGVKPAELELLNLEVEFGDRRSVPLEEVRGWVDNKGLVLEEVVGYFGLQELKEENFWISGGNAMDRGSIAVRMSEDQHGIVRNLGVFDHGEYTNMLGWVRYDVRVIDGEEVMFIHELQSDWYQQGQRNGFEVGPNGEDYDLSQLGWEFPLNAQGQYLALNTKSGKYLAQPGGRTPAAPSFGWIPPGMSHTTGVGFPTRIEAEEAVRASLSPRGPWSTNDAWRRRLLDRLVYEAAERGHTKLAWATGATVVDLWAPHVSWHQGAFDNVIIDGHAFEHRDALVGEAEVIFMEGELSKGSVEFGEGWTTSEMMEGPKGRRKYTLEEIVGAEAAKRIKAGELDVSGTFMGVGTAFHYDKGMVKAAKELKLPHRIGFASSNIKPEILHEQVDEVHPAHVVDIPQHILQDRLDNGVLNYALRPDRDQKTQETLFRRFTIPREGWKERQIGNWQDYFSRVKQVQQLVAEQGGADAAAYDEIDTYLAEERFSGRVMEIHREMEDKYVKPLREMLGELELTDEQKAEKANPEQLLDKILASAEREGWNRKELRDELRANGFRKVVESRVEESILQTGPKVLAPKVNLGRNMIRRGGMVYKYEFDKYASNLEDLGWYVYALHAEERNDEMARRYPALYGSAGSAGSGMATEEANKILDRVENFSPARKQAFVEGAKLVREMNQESLERRIESGLTSAALAAHWAEIYPNYVPLRSDVMDESRDRALAGGYDIRGDDLKMAKGRRSLADNPIIFSIVQYQSTAVRAEKNRVTRTFLEFVRANPDPTQWEEVKVNRGNKDQWQRGPVSGELVNAIRERAEKEGWNEQRLQEALAQLPSIQTASAKAEAMKKRQDIAVKEGGVEYRIAVRDQALLNAMKRMGELETPDWVQTWIGNPTRMLARMNTALDPEFLLRNLTRDLQTAGINLQEFTDTDQRAFTKRVLKDAFSGIRGTWQQLRHEGQARHDAADPDHKWAGIFKDFRAEGGKTAVWTTHDFARAHKKLKKDMAQSDPNNQGVMLRRLKSIAEFVDNGNDAIENGIRVSVFHHARLPKSEGGLGLTSARAASLAKNITVNFNRKGRFGGTLNALYMFANAGIQGNARIIKGYKNSTRIRALVNRLFAAGFLLDLFNRWVGGDDEDGIPHWDKVPEYEKNRNLIIMLNGFGIDEPIKIPLPWGFNLPVTAGRQAMACMPRALKGAGKPATEGAKDLFVASLENFNPLGSGTLLQTIAPTVADPLAMSWENKRWTGAPIRPEQDPYGTYEMPRNQLYWGNVNPVFKGAADWWNQMLGGTKYKPGRLGPFDASVSPEDIEEWVDFATGGLGRFTTRVTRSVAEWGERDVTDNLVNLPFLRSFVGLNPERMTSDIFYEKRGELYKLRDEVDEAWDTKPSEAAQLEKRYAPYMDLIPEMEWYDKELKGVRKDMKDDNVQRGTPAWTAYQAEQDSLKKQFLREYFKASEGNLWWRY